MEQITLVPLQERKDLVNECVELLNSQWSRSKVARLRSLEQSLEINDQIFPVSLLLLERQERGRNKDVLVGFSKLLPVPFDKETCFVESVVVTKKLRGKGYGRLLMEMTEAFAQSKGVRVVHLTTHDQQGFYERLGYETCGPIVVFGGCSSNIAKTLQRLRITQDGPNLENSVENTSCNYVNRANNHTTSQSQLDTVTKTLGKEKTPLPVSRPPPPPPALPKISSKNEKVQILHRPDGSTQSVDGPKIVHMKKLLA